MGKVHKWLIVLVGDRVVPPLVAALTALLVDRGLLDGDASLALERGLSALLSNSLALLSSLMPLA